MRTGNRVRCLEIAIGGATLIGSTASFLLHNAALGVIALVLGGVAYGIAIARPSEPAGPVDQGSVEAQR